MHSIDNTKGFTLIELLIVMGIIAVLAGLTFTNISRPQTTASLAGAVQTLNSDLKSQQLKSMAGDSVSASSAQAHGIYIQPTQYTLFKGATYSVGDGDNLVVPVEAGITLSTTFPSGQILFTKGSGEIANFGASTNTITITNANSAQSQTLTLNLLGRVASN